MVTRIVAIQNLEKYIGQDLAEFAIQFGITIFKEDKQNKGWKGQVLERLAGLSVNNRQAPNGLGFELKSVSFVKRNGIYVPKETMAITMINPVDVVNTAFYESHCWDKLKSLVFCACLWDQTHGKTSQLVSVKSFDFVESNTLIQEIEADYEFIRQKLITQGFSALTGKDGKWIQARTKGKGHGSKSRAFYARPKLIKEIVKV